MFSVFDVLFAEILVMLYELLINVIRAGGLMIVIAHSKSFLNNEGSRNAPRLNISKLQSR